MGGTETIGIGVVAVMMVRLLYMQFNHHEKTTAKLLDLVERDVQSRIAMASNTAELTKTLQDVQGSVKENTELTRNARDTISNVLVEIIKVSARRDG